MQSISKRVIYRGQAAKLREQIPSGKSKTDTERRQRNVCNTMIHCSKQDEDPQCCCMDNFESAFPSYKINLDFNALNQSKQQVSPQWGKGSRRGSSIPRNNGNTQPKQQINDQENPIIKYYKNGGIKEQYNQIDNKRVGDYKMFNEDGTILYHYLYENGNKKNEFIYGVIGQDICAINKNHTTLKNSLYTIIDPVVDNIQSVYDINDYIGFKYMITLNCSQKKVDILTVYNENKTKRKELYFNTKSNYVYKEWDTQKQLISCQLVQTENNVTKHIYNQLYKSGSPKFQYIYVYGPINQTNTEELKEQPGTIIYKEFYNNNKLKSEGQFIQRKDKDLYIPTIEKNILDMLYYKEWNEKGTLVNEWKSVNSENEKYYNILQFDQYYNADTLKCSQIFKIPTSKPLDRSQRYVTTYHENGKIKLKYQYQNSILHSDHKDDLTLDQIVNNKNYYLTGQYLEYYNNEQLKLSQQYRRNMLHGKCIECYSNGKIKKQYNYKALIFGNKSVLTDLYSEYHENGCIFKECSYNENGNIHGQYIEKYGNGNIKISRYYDNGELQGEYLEYYKNGQVYKKGYYESGKLDGIYVQNFVDGQTKISCQYVSGVLENEYYEYYTNGNILKDCQYSMGKLKGQYIENYENGNVRIECFYVDGLLNGDYLEYYENGNMKIDCSYTEGLYHGDYLEYNESGQLTKQCQYSYNSMMM